jgi:hypothetical protein
MGRTHSAKEFLCNLFTLPAVHNPDIDVFDYLNLSGGLPKIQGKMYSSAWLRLL